MIKSIAVTFISPTQEATREEADALFAQLFGAGQYAVGGAEVTPYELSEPYEVFEDRVDPATSEKFKVVILKRDTLSWQGTYAAHPTS